MLDKIIKKLQDFDSNVFLFTPYLRGFLFFPFELPGYISYYHDYSSHNDPYSHESVTVPNKGSDT